MGCRRVDLDIGRIVDMGVDLLYEAKNLVSRMLQRDRTLNLLATRPWHEHGHQNSKHDSECSVPRNLI